MQPLPTDLEILNDIYERHYRDFANYSPAAPTPGRKVYMEVDLTKTAQALGVDPDIVFGRLYYHLDRRFRYRQENNALVSLFSIEIEQGKKHVHFPLLASVLAELRAEDKRERTTNFMSLSALVISIIAIMVSIFVR